MDAADLELRNATYRLFVQGGRAPTAAETAKAAGIDVPSVHAGWRQLHDAHALVLSTSFNCSMFFSSSGSPYISTAS